MAITKILSNNIQNFSANPYRRFDLVAQLNLKADCNTAIQILKQGLHSIPHVLSNPAPVVAILELNSTGLVLAVRPYCQNENYWQVYFDTNRPICESSEAGFLAPE